MGIQELVNNAKRAGLAAFARKGALLQASQEFIEKLPLAIYACDADGRILWFNSQAVHLWGREPRIGDDSEKFCGSYKLYFDGQPIGRDETPMAAVLRTGKAIRGAEGLVERPDGSSMWATVHIEPVQDEEGRIVGAINCFHESTDLHEAIEELEDFFENSPVGLHLVAQDGTILRVNRAELEILGYPFEQYVGRNIREFHADNDAIEDILGALGRNESLKDHPAKLRARDGSIRHVLITSNARFKNGTFVNSRCLTVDITERVRAEEILGQQEQRLKATYHHAAIGIAEVDAHGILQRANAQLARMMGAAPEDLCGRCIFDETHPEDVEADRREFTRQVGGDIERYHIEKRIRRADGNYVWSSISSSTVRDAAGCFLYAVRVQHDITDRKLAEEALARRGEEQNALYEFVGRLQHATTLEEIYACALDAITRALHCSRTSILLFDAKGVMSFVASRGLSQKYQHAVEGHSPWNPDTRDVSPILVPDTRQADFDASLKRAVLAEDIQALAFIPLQNNGTLLGKFMIYYDAPHPFSAAESELGLTIARQLGFAIDRVRADNAACHLAEIVASSHDAIISKSLNGVITSWNQGAEWLFGYSADEILGRPVTVLIPPDQIDEETGILARIREGQRVDPYETVRQRKDGTLVDISLTISPVRDARGMIIGASKIARDITDRKRAELQLKDSEQQLQQLLAAIPAAIYTTDADGKITYYNQAAVDLAGRTPTIGSDEWGLNWKLCQPDGTPLPHDQSPMAVALKEGRPIRNAEAVAERPDGTRVPFIPYCTPLRDSRGRVVGAINMLVDISQRKQAETQQRLLFNELNHRVKNNMQMLQSVLFMGAQRTRSPEAQQVLNEASGRMAAMTAAQQTLYATAGATRFRAQEFLGAVCQTIQQTFPPDVTVETEVAEGELPYDAAMPLALILNELLTNAVKHGLHSQKGTIRVGLKQSPTGFVLYVQDNGKGFNLSSVRGRSSGLQLVQGLARQLRGGLDVQVENGTRCVVEFSL